MLSIVVPLHSAVEDFALSEKNPSDVEA